MSLILSVLGYLAALGLVALVLIAPMLLASALSPRVAALRRWPSLAALTAIARGPPRRRRAARAAALVLLGAVGGRALSFVLEPHLPVEAAVLPDASRAAISSLYQSDLSQTRVGIPVTRAQLRAVVNAVDDWVDTNAASFNSAIPQPQRGLLTAKEKANILEYVVRRRMAEMP